MSAIWVTGARGFIGRHLAKDLALGGANVSGLGHGHWPSEDAKSWGVSSWLNSDITTNNLDILCGKSERPDVIYHLAGGSAVGASIENPRNDFSKTVDAASELLEWIRLESPKTRLVAVSSAAVYGSSHSGSIREEDSIRPYSPYGYHKLLMEELCRCYAEHYGIELVIVRLFSVYGQQLKKQLLWDLCCKLKEATGTVVLGGSGGELRDWTDVRDIVRALPLISQIANSQAPTFNFGTGVGTSVSEIAGMVVQAWSAENGGAAKIKFNGNARLGDPFSLIADVGRTDMLDVKASVSVDTGIRDYVRWFVSSSGSVS